MTIDASLLTALVDGELAKISDIRVRAHINALRVQPTVSLRDWDYGREGQQYPCWIVLRHSASDTGIAHCEFGFGPRSPWGLITLKDYGQGSSIGMDCSWYTTFVEAFFATSAAADLPIWRVFMTDGPLGERRSISDEGNWDTTFAKVRALRSEDPANRYECSTSIEFERE
ncbi:MAG: hypothetical protein ABL893_21405 [Hyphomicrobium sp.]